MPAEEQQDQSADVVQEIKRICYGLQSDNKRVRKQSLVDMQKRISEQDLSNQELREIFNETHVFILNTFRDKAEAVREQGIKFMTYFILDKLPMNDYYLTYVFPVIVERVGTVELIEESEEIRLQLVQCLHAIILKYSNTIQLKPFLNDAVTILKETVKDKFPDVKEESCKCIVDLAKALPRDFHLQAESLVKPVATAFKHQRYKIRVEAIKCMGEIILHCTYKGLDDAIVPMAERLFDSIPVVRQTVADVAGRWLLEYRDRYSFFAKLLPLLLTGLNDEVPETREKSQTLWIKVGLQYMQENEKDLKDQMDFLIKPPEYYPKHLTRPNLGCRALVQRTVGRLAPAIARELTAWQPDIKVRTSQLLCAIALHAEEGLTQHLQALLCAMYSSARDEDEKVVANIIQASELMGLFVPTETWSKLILPAIEDGPHFGHLTVLAGFIEGSPKDRIHPHLSEISTLLSDKIICQSRRVKYQRELTKCIKAMMNKCKLNDVDVGRDIFLIAVTLISLKDQQNEEINDSLLDDLYKCLGFQSSYELWSKYTDDVLKTVEKDPKSWTVLTAERCIFETILLKSGEAFGENLEMISEILSKCLDPDADAESRLKTFVALSVAFENKDVIFRNTKDLNVFLEKLVENILVPTLVWHAGRTAEAMRTMGASCLASALNPGQGVQLFSSAEIFNPIFEKLMPLLLTLLEDASYRSRQLAVENFILLKETAVRLNCWKMEDLIKIYPELLKRLDDPTDKVRICALKSLPVFFKDIPKGLQEPTFKAHFELIADTLLTHFDDDEDNIQSLVSDALKVIGNSSSKIIQQKIERYKPVLRNKKGCDEILEYLKNNESISL